MAVNEPGRFERVYRMLKNFVAQGEGHSEHPAETRDEDEPQGLQRAIPRLEKPQEQASNQAGESSRSDVPKEGRSGERWGNEDE